MIYKEKIYTVIWDLKSLTQLYSLPFNESEIKLIKSEIDRVLSINPYGNFKDIKFNFKDWKTNVKFLKEDWKGRWRIRIGDYIILYKVEEDKILVRISRVKSRINAYNHEDDEN